MRKTNELYHYNSEVGPFYYTKLWSKYRNQWNKMGQKKSSFLSEIAMTSRARVTHCSTLKSTKFANNRNTYYKIIVTNKQSRNCNQSYFLFLFMGRKWLFGFCRDNSISQKVSQYLSCGGPEKLENKFCGGPKQQVEDIHQFLH